MKRVGWLSLVFVPLLIVACRSSSDGDSEGAGGASTSPGTSTAGASESSQNQVSYGGQDYALKSGLEEVFAPKSRDNHSGSRLNVTNGTYYKEQVSISGNLDWIWRVRNASVWFYMKVYSPGSKGLKSGTFNYASNTADKNDSSLAGKYFFQKGKFAVDMDGDGKLESKAGEFLKIVGGRVSVEKKGSNYKVDFRFSLENGVTATGSYTGDFTQV